MNLDESTLAVYYAAVTAEAREALKAGQVEEWFSDRLEDLIASVRKAPDGEEFAAAVMNLGAMGPAIFAASWAMLAESLIKERSEENGRGR